MMGLGRNAARHRCRKAARRRTHMTATTARNRLHGVRNYQQLVEKLGSEAS